MTALRERSAFHSCLWTRAGLGRTAATAMPSVASCWLRPLRGVSEVDTRFSAQGVPVSTPRISLPRLDRSPSALPPGPRAGAPSRQRLISSHAVARSLPQVWLLLGLDLWPSSLSRTPGRPLSSRRANSPLPPLPSTPSASSARMQAAAVILMATLPRFSAVYLRAVIPWFPQSYQRG